MHPRMAVEHFMVSPLWIRLPSTIVCPNSDEKYFQLVSIFIIDD
jgi:hypothetical protein